MRVWSFVHWFLVVGLCALGCSLNPQPLPPDTNDATQGGTQDSGSQLGNDAGKGPDSALDSASGDGESDASDAGDAADASDGDAREGGDQ